jgi:hypothetical protein
VNPVAGDDVGHPVHDVTLGDAPAYQLRVSRRLRDDFDNGEHYYQYENSDLWVPRAA